MATLKRKPKGLIRRRGTGWQVIIRIGGERHQYGPRTEPILASGSRLDVEEWVEREYKRLQRDAQRKADGLPGQMAFSVLLDRYEADPLKRLAPNTRKTYAGSLARFRAFFVDKLGDPRVDRIRSPHIRQYLRWREDEDGVSLRTVAKDRATLHAIFTYATKDLEITDSNPVANVDPPKHDAREPIILSGDQYEKLIEACDDPMLRLYALFLGETGARCDSEALWLRWEDLDLDSGFVAIVSGRAGRRTKSGKSRWVPLTPRLRQALREHVLRIRGAEYAGKSSPWVFHHTRTRRHAAAGERLGSLRRAFAGAAKRAKLPADLHQHDLRHRRVTTWLAEGRDLMKVKEAMGHSTVKVTEGYSHLAREHLRTLVEEPATKRAEIGA